MAIWRVIRTMEETGDSRSKLYADSAAGLMVKPIKIGPRAAGFPSEEVQAVVAARVAGYSQAELRNLVLRLESARRHKADSAVLASCQLAAG